MSPLSPTAHRRFLTALFAGVGTAHLVPATAKQFDAIIPPQLPGPPRAYTIASGVAELGIAAALSIPATEKKAGIAAAALLVAVFPANVTMAVDYRQRGAPRLAQAIAFARLPGQLPLLYSAFRVARGA